MVPAAAGASSRGGAGTKAEVAAHIAQQSAATKKTAPKARLRREAMPSNEKWKGAGMRTLDL